MNAKIALLLAALACAGCGPMPSRIGFSAAEWHSSPNFDARRPTYVILHYTTNETIDQALATLTDPKTRVSAHYLIARDGGILQLVDERERAWHAGESSWRGARDLNSRSIGIELDNRGDEPYLLAQIDALIVLLSDLSARYKLSATSYLGHSDVAPTRKSDPGKYFPWRLLATHGFGFWCDEPLLDAPADFDALLALRLLGYDVSDVAAAIRAFKLHYVQEDSVPLLTARDVRVLACLVERTLQDTSMPGVERSTPSTSP